MASRQMFDIINKDIEIGYISCGWKCIQHFQHHNLWQRVSTTNANGIKTCFPKKSST